MTMIRKITDEEFQEAYSSRKGFGAPLNEESEAALRLEVNESIAMPCRWTHTKKTNGCTGSVSLWRLGKRKNKKFQTRCKDKTLYIKRIA